MNVTVLIPSSLRGAMEGRKSVELGVPARANVGDVLETLLKLYPKLAHYLTNERRGGRQQLGVWLDSSLTRDVVAPPDGVREGQLLYLFAAPQPTAPRVGLV